MSRATRFIQDAVQAAWITLVFSFDARDLHNYVLLNLKVRSAEIDHARDLRVQRAP